MLLSEEKGVQALSKAPSAATVLVRCLMANRTYFERHLQPDDWLLVPPVPVAMGAMGWRRHSELVETAYRYWSRRNRAAEHINGLMAGLLAA